MTVHDSRDVESGQQRTRAARFDAIFLGLPPMLLPIAFFFVDRAWVHRDLSSTLVAIAILALLGVGSRASLALSRSRDSRLAGVQGFVALGALFAWIAVMRTSDDLMLAWAVSMTAAQCLAVVLTAVLVSDEA